MKNELESREWDSNPPLKWRHHPHFPFLFLFSTNHLKISQQTVKGSFPI